jgi:3D (Asp-Asp-Asp) domain-containing protein
MYYRKKKSKRFLLIFAVIAILFSSGAYTSSRFYSDKVLKLETELVQVKTQLPYYEEIERKFLETKAEGLVIQKYEEKLETKDLIIKEKENAVEQAKKESESKTSEMGRLESTVRRLMSRGDERPRNYVMPTEVDKGGLSKYKDPVPVGTWKLTYYAPNARECGNDKGITASGKPVQPGQNIAIDPKYWKFGQKFYIEGLGEFIATDTGSAIKGRERADVCVMSTAISSMGVEHRKVWLIKE